MELHIRRGPHSLGPFRLGEGPNVAGRADDCDILLPSRRVSRHHCVFEVYDGRVTVRDLGSHNGVVGTDGRRVSNLDLVPGQEVLIGDYHLSLTDGETAPVADSDLDLDDAEEERDPADRWPPAVRPRPLAQRSGVYDEGAVASRRGPVVESLIIPLLLPDLGDMDDQSVGAALVTEETANPFLLASLPAGPVPPLFPASVTASPRALGAPPAVVQSAPRTFPAPMVGRAPAAPAGPPDPAASYASNPWVRAVAPAPAPAPRPSLAPAVPPRPAPPSPVASPPSPVAPLAGPPLVPAALAATPGASLVPCAPVLRVPAAAPTARTAPLVVAGVFVALTGLGVELWGLDRVDASAGAMAAEVSGEEARLFAGSPAFGVEVSRYDALGLSLGGGAALEPGLLRDAQAQGVAHIGRPGGTLAVAVSRDSAGAVQGYVTVAGPPSRLKADTTLLRAVAVIQAGVGLLVVLAAAMLSSRRF